MKLVIGNMDKKTIEFIKKSIFTEKMLIINKMCNVKKIKDDVDIIIPYNIIMKSGNISNTLVHLEELIITLNVKKVFYSNSYNIERMNYLSKTYNIETIKFDISDNVDKYKF